MKIFFLKKFVVIIFILSAVAISGTTFINPPEAEITNGLIHAHLYLPDIENGYYRGSRFDWAGIISDLEYKGHTFYGQWFPKYAPTIHDFLIRSIQEVESRVEIILPSH